MTDRERFTLEEVLATFDEHLRRTRGVCAGTRRNYAKYVGEFLAASFEDRAVEFAKIRPAEVASLVAGLSRGYQPRTGLPRLWLTPMVGGSQAASAAE